MNNNHQQGVQKSLFAHLLPWLICGVGAAFYIYEYVLRITPGVITHELMAYFGINALVVSNLAAFYYYAYTPMQLPVGVLMDRFGPRRLLTFACLCCVVGSYMFGSTTHLTIASIGRFLVGFGSAFAFVGVLKLATIWLPPNRFALISGLTSGLGAVGAAIGFVSIQHIVNHVNWHHMIMITAFSGVILAATMFFVIKDKPQMTKARHAEIDWKDVIQGFIAVIKNPYMWVNGLVGCLLYLPASVFAELWGKPYLQAAHGYTANAAAVSVSLIFFGFTVGGPIFGFVSDFFRHRRYPMMVGAFCAAIIFTIILYVPNLSHTTINILLFVFGMSYGAQIIVFAVGRELSPVFAAATAIAVTNMFVMLSGSVFETMVGKFLTLGWDHTIKQGVPVYSGLDFTHALTLIPVALLVGIVFMFFLKETHATISHGTGVEKDKVISD